MAPSEARLRGHSSVIVTTDAAHSVAREPRSPIRKRWRGKRPPLVSYNQIPEWYRDNEYIRHGYRPVSESASRSFASWFYMHNETLNIYTHMLPAVYFLISTGSLLSHLRMKYENMTFLDACVFIFFLAMATTCLGLSTIYHTLLNHSQSVETIWLRLDLSGIVFLTLGDLLSGIYMVFWCEPVLRNSYWAMISTLGAFTILLMVNPKVQGQEWRTFRALTLVFTGLSGFIPVIHGTIVFGVSRMMEQSGLPYYLAEGALLLLGALIYTTRFPEHLSPGTFDVYGSSHQLFHVLVVFATVTQLAGILSAYDYNYNHRQCRVV